MPLTAGEQARQMQAFTYTLVRAHARPKQTTDGGLGEHGGKHAQQLSL